MLPFIRQRRTGEGDQTCGFFNGRCAFRRMAVRKRGRWAKMGVAAVEEVVVHVHAKGRKNKGVESFAAAMAAVRRKKGVCGLLVLFGCKRERERQEAGWATPRKKMG